VRNWDAADDCAEEAARVDRALRRMKTELALTELRRRLLQPGVDARTVLEISDRIEMLQAGR
jgi:hypothetical protein